MSCRYAVGNDRCQYESYTLFIGVFLGAWLGFVLSGDRGQAPSPIGVTRFSLVLEGSQSITNYARNALALSPDGRTVAFLADDRLYIKEMGESAVRPLPGTEDASGPFFSPDGTWIAFRARGFLKKVALDGTMPVSLHRTGQTRGGAWPSPDEILYAARSGVYRIAASGGTPELLAEARQGVFRHPELLPDGDTLLVTSFPGEDVGQVVAISLRTGERKVVVARGSDAQYLRTGHLLFVEEGALVAAPFDLETLELRANPVPVVDSVVQSIDSESAQFAVSDSGTLVYLDVLNLNNARLVWVDREGGVEPLTEAAHAYSDVRFSPDGNRFAVHNRSNENDIWFHDVGLGTMARLTLGNSEQETPVWSPDGRFVAFVSAEVSASSARTFYRKAADGSGEREKLWDGRGHGHVADWTPGGRQLVVELRGDVYLLNLEGEPSLTPLLDGPFVEKSSRLSPDGRWIAYASDETGREEVYVQPFPDGGSKHMVSRDGGLQPIWSPDGATLFFRGETHVMEVSVALAPEFQSTRPVSLFEDRFHRPRVGGHTSYDVSPDGRFLMLERESAGGKGRFGGSFYIEVVINWFEELERRVPTDD